MVAAIEHMKSWDSQGNRDLVGMKGLSLSIVLAVSLEAIKTTREGVGTLEGIVKVADIQNLYMNRLKVKR